MKRTCLALSIAAFLAFVSAVQADDNMLVNPGFENGDLTGWTTFGFGWRIGTGDHANTGTKGLYATDEMESEADVWRGVYQDVKVTPRESYSAGVSIRAGDVRYSSAWLEINWTDDNGHVIHQLQSRHVTRDQRFTPANFKKVRAPAGATRASIRGIFHMPAKPRHDQAVFSFDDFYFQPD